MVPEGLCWMLFVLGLGDGRARKETGSSCVTEGSLMCSSRQDRCEGSLACTRQNWEGVALPLILSHPIQRNGRGEFDVLVETGQVRQRDANERVTPSHFSPVLGYDGHFVGHVCPAIRAMHGSRAFKSFVGFVGFKVCMAFMCATSTTCVQCS